MKREPTEFLKAKHLPKKFNQKLRRNLKTCAPSIEFPDHAIVSFHNFELMSGQY